MTLPKTYTVSEVAEMVDRDPETVRRWIRNGYLEAARIGREYRLSAAELNRWFSSRGGGTLVPSGDEPLAESLELEAPESLDDARQLAGRLEQLAAELHEVADDLEEWSGKLSDAVEVQEGESDENGEHEDEWTEDMFDE